MKVNIKKLKESIKDSNITIEKHHSEDLYIFGYYKHPLSKTKSLWNQYSIMCRGLILNGEGEIIERAFDKFWTFRNHITENVVQLSENRIVNLPESKPKIYEKLDGTMGILYWVNGIPYIATQRSFSSLKARKGSEIIQEKYYSEAKKLDRQYSYIFEVLYPEASLVVDYQDREDLVLIGVIDKNTGRSIENISEFGFKTKKDLTDQFENFSSLTEIEDANIYGLEGVVLEYDNSLRIKIKFPWYKEVHKELQNIINADYQIIESVKKLKKYYNYPNQNLTSNLIVESIKNGEDKLERIIGNLNIDQIDHSVIQWLERHKNLYLKENKIIDEYFYNSLEFKNTPDDRMWNWKKRYLNKYYD
ncbi:hypothetical protein BBH99_00265 [Chryseobacterium contaminans]|uniref:RNA ligase n=1 Tax=Chryseobacterium contaminans TaxID=1423959 RepID=A0A1M6VNF8_9FLAO|nr:hypothetical protein [Chryseobacterium contaminans]OCA80571.1 hypothetical protein BBH99_00265 [Chryseobacterium contaminans]SHK82861.1 hypothetical protein SAMN05444407_101286 [Chryseobacterium contaminans]